MRRSYSLAERVLVPGVEQQVECDSMSVRFSPNSFTPSCLPVVMMLLGYTLTHPYLSLCSLVICLSTLPHIHLSLLDMQNVMNTDNFENLFYPCSPPLLSPSSFRLVYTLFPTDGTFDITRFSFYLTPISQEKMPRS